ncbi:hypothetical protein BESB_043880 [Besnoitia besnoiti]|uniref:Uncharacterized protein n=1 Tax=Besnoitia besnoiti TaxID=94643 RepID=A0A2A9MJQ5_BESBE|nr:hypothetical protein BESB_043880 [Besnoitia besnoiti]PFH36196.1 hypothetical protein BESB_043880 [Besnoitia besnoiti]
MEAVLFFLQRTLVVGDDNFSFSVCLADHSAFAGGLDVACGLQESLLSDDANARARELRSRGVHLHFGVNPAQLRNFFSLVFDRLLLVLPGLAYHGCPPLVDFGSELFRLRLHLFCFSVLKSSRPVVKPSGDALLLWPSSDPQAALLEAFPDAAAPAGGDSLESGAPQAAAKKGPAGEGDDARAQIRDAEQEETARLEETRGEGALDEGLTQGTESGRNGEQQEETRPASGGEDRTPEASRGGGDTPACLQGFPMIQFDKLAKFCAMTRAPMRDLRLDLRLFGAWAPSVHRHEAPDGDQAAQLFDGIKEKRAPWLSRLVFHSLLFQEEAKESGAHAEEFNILRVPASVMKFSREVLPHVNELFLFKLFGCDSTSVTISKLSLKYDPRIAGWRGQGVGGPGRPAVKGPGPARGDVPHHGGGYWHPPAQDPATAHGLGRGGPHGPPGFRPPPRPHVGTGGPFYGSRPPGRPAVSSSFAESGAGVPPALGDVRGTLHSRPVGLPSHRAPGSMGGRDRPVPRRSGGAFAPLGGDGAQGPGEDAGGHHVPSRPYGGGTSSPPNGNMGYPGSPGLGGHFHSRVAPAGQAEGRGAMAPAGPGWGEGPSVAPGGRGGRGAGDDGWRGYEPCSNTGYGAARFNAMGPAGADRVDGAELPVYGHCEGARKEQAFLGYGGAPDQSPPLGGYPHGPPSPPPEPGYRGPAASALVHPGGAPGGDASGYYQPQEHTYAYADQENQVSRPVLGNGLSYASEPPAKRWRTGDPLLADGGAAPYAYPPTISCRPPRSLQETGNSSWRYAASEPAAYDPVTGSAPCDPTQGVYSGGAPGGPGERGLGRGTLEAAHRYGGPAGSAVAGGWGAEDGSAALYGTAYAAADRYYYGGQSPQPGADPRSASASRMGDPEGYYGTQGGGMHASSIHHMNAGAAGGGRWSPAAAGAVDGSLSTGLPRGSESYESYCSPQQPPVHHACAPPAPATAYTGGLTREPHHRRPAPGSPYYGAPTGDVAAPARPAGPVTGPGGLSGACSAPAGTSAERAGGQGGNSYAVPGRHGCASSGENGYVQADSYTGKPYARPAGTPYAAPGSGGPGGPYAAGGGGTSHASGYSGYGAAAAAGRSGSHVGSTALGPRATGGYASYCSSAYGAGGSSSTASGASAAGPSGSTGTGAKGGYAYGRF